MKKPFELTPSDCVSHLTSGRIYLPQGESVTPFDESLLLFNGAKFFAYNQSFNYHAEGVTKPEPSLFEQVKNRYKMNSYYSNSAVNLGDGALKSQIEIQKERLGSLNEKIKDAEKKYNQREKQVQNRKKEIEKVNKYIDTLKEKPDTKKVLNLNCFNGVKIEGYKVTKYTNRKSGKTEETTLLKFLYQDLQPSLRFFKNKQKQTLYFLNNTKQKRQNAEKLKRVWFNKLHPKRRYLSLQLSGRADSNNHNFPVHVFYKGEGIYQGKKSEDFKVEFQLYDSSIIKFEVQFTYGGHLLKDALASKNHFPIAFGIRKGYDSFHKRWYLIFETVLNLRSFVPIPADICKGAIGIDLNVGHIDWAETSSTGNLLDYGSVPYEVNGTSSENELSLHQALKTVIKHASHAGKPVIIEDLDTEKSKWKSTYRSKALNRTYHLFPYSRYTRIAIRTALEYNTETFLVKPAMTSIIGSLKYARFKNLPSHIAAAYIIARRGQGYEEKIPKGWKNLVKGKTNWKQWSSLWKLNSEMVKKKFDRADNERYKSNILFYKHTDSKIKKVLI